MVRMLTATMLMMGTALGQDIATLKVGTSLVLVPTMVRTKAGETVFTLTADDFMVTDDGVPQKVRLEEDTGAEPIALVVVVEAGGTPETKFADYAGLATMLDAIVGGAEHKVAVVGFDSQAQVVQGFTGDLDKAEAAFPTIETGDGGAASLDALSMAVGMLRGQPLRYRRAILFVGETVDRGSKLSLAAALKDLSDGNTVIYALSYSTTRATTKHELGESGSSGVAGPPHGCMGKYPDVDLEGNPLPEQENQKGQGENHGNVALKAYDCLSLLAPPLRLAKIAVFLAINGFKTNVPEAAARLTGGEYFKVENAKALTKDLQKISNRLPNRYYLSFTPSKSHPGLHSINVSLKETRPGVLVEARTGYWEDAR